MLILKVENVFYLSMPQCAKSQILEKKDKISRPSQKQIWPDFGARSQIFGNNDATRYKFYWKFNENRQGNLRSSDATEEVMLSKLNYN